MDGMALGVDERVGLVESLRRREPLEGRGRWGSGVDDSQSGVVGEGDGELGPSDWVRGGEREGKRRVVGAGIGNGVDGERASVEVERAGVLGREVEYGGAVDGEGSEVKVECEGDVGGEWVS